ncbi:nucleotidyltransferase family protein [Rhodococcus gannanensis]|uniref:NTP transferase domain-containing protein n=1 Tax=Rhodococcus gannanensis TaxID=1960308 RepID=A0ABW4PAT6_9NOCA
MTVDPSHRRATGVLLAAGAGARYGEPKVLSHHGLWLDSAVTALRRGGCDRVLVVLGAATPPLPRCAEAVFAPNWAVGVSESLRAGLSAAADDPGTDFAVVHLVDLPDVGSPVVARVLGAATRSPGGLARAWFGERPGHPVVLARRHWNAVSESAVGDSGAREYLREHDSLVLRVPCGDLATGADRDHPTGFERAPG